MQETSLGHYIQDDLDRKILILFAMSQLTDPISAQQLYELCSVDRGVEYFTFQTSLASLLKTGHLAQGEMGIVRTDLGKKHGADTVDTLPFSVKRRVHEQITLAKGETPKPIKADFFDGSM